LALDSQLNVPAKEKDMIGKLTRIAALFAGVGAMTSAHAALNLEFIEGTAIPAPYVAYDDAKSYSLPVLGFLHEYITNGVLQDSIQPGNPYYVNSTPGAIKDLIVVATGASGGPVNENFAGMDNAYATPNSPAGQPFKDPFFSTGTVTDPGEVAPFAGDSADTWDMRLSSFADFLGTEAPIFLFNNNQVNSGGSTDQSLAAWMAITLHDEQDATATRTLYFRNRTDGSDTPGKYALVSEGGGGVLNGTVGNGTSGVAVGPVAGTGDSTDYVLSGGGLCYKAPPSLDVVSCSSPDAFGGPINHNLGANEAVYALVFPELNRILELADFGGYDYLSIDIRLGCDPSLSPKDPVCDGRSLSNGYEQLFIATATTTTNVPEPGALALMGAALGGLAFARRRKS
jgi:hypothetical protein